MAFPPPPNPLSRQALSRCGHGAIAVFIVLMLPPASRAGMPDYMGVVCGVFALINALIALRPAVSA